MIKLDPIKHKPFIEQAISDGYHFDVKRTYIEYNNRTRTIYLWERGKNNHARLALAKPFNHDITDIPIQPPITKKDFPYDIKNDF